VDILLLDRRDWLREGLLPAGNLREPVEAARRATVIAIPAPDGAAELEAALHHGGSGRRGRGGCLLRHRPPAAVF
jgi:tetraacyldisaccharide 4'-kinase